MDPDQLVEDSSVAPSPTREDIIKDEHPPNKTEVIEPIELHWVDLQRDLLEKGNHKYSTGLYPLDRLLGGGFELGTLNDFIGFTSCGKTYLMLSICLQLISKHDLGVVILSDSTEEVADSLCSILEEKNLDSDTIDFMLERVKLTTFDDTEDLEKSLKILLNFPENNLLATHKVLLVDGLSALFLEHYSEPDLELNEQLYRCVHTLRQICVEFNALVLITHLRVLRNEVGSIGWQMNDKNDVEITDPDWSSFMDNRFVLNKSKSLDGDIELEIQTLKSRSLRTGSGCVLSITENGFS